MTKFATRPSFAVAAGVIAATMGGMEAKERRQEDADALLASASQYGLRYYGDPELHTSCEHVPDPSLVHPAIPAAMRRVLKTWRYCGQTGVGIAAPQVGALLRIILVPLEHGAEPQLLFNPRVVRTSDERILGEESCMSIPGYRANVRRWAWVDLEWEDEENSTLFRRVGADTVALPSIMPSEDAAAQRANEHRVARDELQPLARIVQHECDHLAGKTIVLKDRQQRRAAERCVEQGRADARLRGLA